MPATFQPQADRPVGAVLNNGPAIILLAGVERLTSPTDTAGQRKKVATPLKEHNLLMAQSK